MAIPRDQPDDEASGGPLTKRWRAVRLLAKRGDWLLAELTLALPPTITVLVALIATRALTQHPILFASLASSAFLIYRDPRHPMNRVKVVVPAQLLGAGIGIASSFLLGTGYLAAAAAMTLTITLLIIFRIVHPPAVSTTLGFSLVGTKYGTLDTFLLALGLVASLALMQRATIQLLQQAERWLGRTFRS